MTERKIALVGIGKIAVDQHIPSIAASSDWQLSATVSRNGAVDGLETFTDIDAMLAARPDIDCVSLCLPPVPRYEYAVKALKSDRHVMLEKPPGATIAECNALTDIARQAGLSLFATWHSREADQVAAAKAWLATRQIRRITTIWKEDVRRWHPGQEWIFEPGGLGVFDPGINALSILTEILPRPMHVSDAVLEVPENRQTPIAASLRFFYEGAESATAEFDWRQEGEQTWTIEVQTTDGTLKLLDGGARMIIDGKEQGVSDDVALGGEYPRLYKQFADLVRAGGIDMDLRPLFHVADAFSRGERRLVTAFNW